MIFKYAIVLLILTTALLQGGIEHYLKPIDDKTGYHQIPGVDFIYIINLNERPEKFHFCITQLAAFDIYPCRFSAINGWKLPPSAFSDLGVKFESWMTPDMLGTCFLPEDNGLPHHEVMSTVGRNYFCHETERGTVATVLSHLSVLQDAYNAGYETVWVMEDDIHVVQNPHVLSTLIQKLDETVGKEEWDVLFTDQDIKDRKGDLVPCYSYAPRPNFTPADPNRFAMRRDIDDDFQRIGARYGTHSMILRRSGIKKILEFILQYGIFLPYDMDVCMPDDIRFYSLRYDVVSNFPGAPTDCYRPGYEEAQGIWKTTETTPIETIKP